MSRKKLTQQNAEKVLQKRKREALQDLQEWLHLNLGCKMSVGDIDCLDLPELAEVFTERAADIQYLRDKLNARAHLTK